MKDLPEYSKEECKNGEGDVEVELEECGNEFEEGHTSQQSVLFPDVGG